MTIEISMEEIRQCVGIEVFVSDRKEVGQDQINQFADCTGDHQRINVDLEEADRGPFGKTIAHDFLILSHIPFFNQNFILSEAANMVVNYGIII